MEVFPTRWGKTEHRCMLIRGKEWIEFPDRNARNHYECSMKIDVSFTLKILLPKYRKYGHSRNDDVLRAGLGRILRNLPTVSFLFHRNMVKCTILLMEHHKNVAKLNSLLFVRDCIRLVYDSTNGERPTAVCLREEILSLRWRLINAFVYQWEWCVSFVDFSCEIVKLNVRSDNCGCRSLRLHVCFWWRNECWKSTNRTQ